jgi:hypothetical protein
MTLGAWALAAVACVFLISLGTDEAWVLNGLRSALRRPIADQSSEIAGANAGLFAVANLAIEWALGNRVWAHRLFSLACLAGILALAYLRGARRGGGATSGLIAIAPLATLPGTAEIGTVALGHACAVLLFVAAAWEWTRRPAPGLGRAVWCGVLLGLGAGSRLEMMLTLPAFCVATCVVFDDSRLRLRMPSRALWVALVVAAVVLMLDLALVRLGTQADIPRDDVARFWQAKGVGSPLQKLINYPSLLNKLLIGLSFMPLFALVLAAIVPFWKPWSDDAPGEDLRFEWMLVVAGCVLWLGWFIAAPIPHLRYLWPSLACLAIAAGSGLAAWHARLHGPKAMTLRLLAACLALGGVLGTARSLVMGEHDYMSWEWSREMGADYYRRFQANKDQAAAALYLHNAAPDYRVVYTFGPPYILRYLADRPVIDLGAAARGEPGAALVPDRPCLVIFSPAVGAYFYMRPAAYEWFANNGHPVREFGRYAFLRLDARWPDDPSFLAPVRSNYESHPNAAPWFGREGSVRTADK